jgi:hypothetical protein
MCQSGKEFEDISYSGIIKNCVGAVDGDLLSIITPQKSQTKNVRSYFSSHYQKHGVNIQACCDTKGRFTFLGVGGPGVTNDCQGIEECGLFDKIDALPTVYVTIADCAYQPTEYLVPIFGGDLVLHKDEDNFNFFASQLRIRIEMAFGVMTRKWGILQRPLTTSLASIPHIICRIACLHKFCINERLESMATSTTSMQQESYFNGREESLLSPAQLASMYAAAEAEHREMLSEEYAQWSVAPDELVSAVKQQGLKRLGANPRNRRTTEE